MAIDKKKLAKKARKITDSLDKNRCKASIAEEKDGQIMIQFSIPTPWCHAVPAYIILASGMMPGTCNVIMTALPGKPLKLEENIRAIAAFLNRLSMLLSPVHFLLDLPSRQILIRQSLVCAMDVQPDPRLFIQSIQQTGDDLASALSRLELEQCSVRDARLMADFISESCYEAMQP